MNEVNATESKKKRLDLNSTLSTNQKSAIAVLWFVMIFGTLLTLASFFDLQISQMLTKPYILDVIGSGKYYFNSGFGRFFEILGAFPIWILIAVAGTIFFWNFNNVKNKWGKGFGMFFAFAIGVVAFYFFFHDCFKYVCEYIAQNTSGRDFIDQAPLLGLQIVLAIGAETLLVLAWKNIDAEMNKKLLRFALVIALTAAFYLIIQIIKVPMGRMRYRTIVASNVVAENYFTGWWVPNGKRVLFNDLPKDQCMSFPSGHTFSAGVCYALISLIELVPAIKKNGWAKFGIWFSTIAYTGIVAISRIVVGAHYFSDVLFGGTIAFLGAMLGREIFVFNCEHFKAFGKLFAKNQCAKQQANSQCDCELKNQNEVEDVVVENQNLIENVLQEEKSVAENDDNKIVD